MVGKGGALPRCCAPPHEQIFDIPALSRGGGAQTAKFPPPSGLIGLTLPRVGTREQARVCSPETHSRTPTAAYTLKGNNGRLKTLEELSTSNSLHAAVPGGSHFRFGRLSLFIRQAGTQCGINGQGLRAHPPPPALSLSPLSEGSDAVPCFSEIARCCFRFSFGSGLATPCLATSAGLKFFLPVGFLFSFSVI